MRTHSKSRGGFTLIEIIAVLLLTALAFVFTAMLLVTSTEVFIGDKNAAEDSQKIQVAMNRLVKELTFASAGTVNITNGGQTVSWTSAHPDRLGEGTQTATWNGTSGTNLTLGSSPLLDNVDAFTIASTADSITITLRSSRSTGVTNTTIIHPRYEL